MDKVNLAQKLAQFSDHWSPKVVGEINDFALKVVKVQGEFVWHHHDQEDELFLVVKGRLGMQVREPDAAERTIWIEEGEFIVIPHGIEHCPTGRVHPPRRHNARTKDRSPPVMSAQNRLDRVGPEKMIPSRDQKGVRAAQ